MSQSNNQQNKELTAKDGIFLMHIAQNMISNGAKIDWHTVAKGTGYKTGPSAYMGFSRIKKKLDWPSDDAKHETTAARVKRKVEDEDPADEAPPPKRSRRKPAKQVKTDDGDEAKEDFGGNEKGAEI